jgi:hypothetical protein
MRQIIGEVLRENKIAAVQPQKLCDNFLAFVLFCGYMLGKHGYALEILPYAVDAFWQLFPSFYFLVCIFSGR